jgi:hypothetical protein
VWVHYAMLPSIPLKEVVIAAYGDTAVSTPCETATKRKSSRKNILGSLTVPIFEAADALGGQVGSQLGTYKQIK